MALSPPAPRKPIHSREIVCHAFERADGLWDLEASLHDTKAYAIANRDRGCIQAGEPVHGMWLRLVIDDDFVVRDVEVSMEHTPYAICRAIEPAHRQLIGASIGPGWSRQVRALLGGTGGCTHLREMLGRMATAAFQALYGRRRAQGKEDAKARRRPWVIDGCHAWAADGPVVKAEFPEWYRGPAGTGPEGGR